MLKPELVKELAKKLDVTQDRAKEIVEAYEETVVEGTKRDGVCNTGLGKFELVHKDAHMARNPKTNEEVQVEAYDGIKLKVASKLKKF